MTWWCDATWRQANIIISMINEWKNAHILTVCGYIKYWEIIIIKKKNKKNFSGLGRRETYM